MVFNYPYTKLQYIDDDEIKLHDEPELRQDDLLGLDVVDKSMKSRPGGMERAIVIKG